MRQAVINGNCSCLQVQRLLATTNWKRAACAPGSSMLCWQRQIAQMRSPGSNGSPSRKLLALKVSWALSEGMEYYLGTLETCARASSWELGSRCISCISYDFKILVW